MITIIKRTHLENMEHPTSKLQRKCEEGRQMCREVLPRFFQKSLRVSIMLTLMHDVVMMMIMMMAIMMEILNKG